MDVQTQENAVIILRGIKLIQTKEAKDRLTAEINLSERMARMAFKRVTKWHPFSLWTAWKYFRTLRNLLDENVGALNPSTARQAFVFAKAFKLMAEVQSWTDSHSDFGVLNRGLTYSLLSARYFEIAVKMRCTS